MAAEHSAAVLTGEQQMGQMVMESRRSIPILATTALLAAGCSGRERAIAEPLASVQANSSGTKMAR
jgi:hypothetical protein